MTLPKKLWLVGCGNMGGAMLARWIADGMDPASVTVIDPGTPVVPHGVRVTDTIPDEPAPDAIVLAVKPQHLDTIAPTARYASPWVSIIDAASASFGVLPPHRTNWNTG